MAEEEGRDVGEGSWDGHPAGRCPERRAQGAKGR